MPSIAGIGDRVRMGSRRFPQVSCGVRGGFVLHHAMHHRRVQVAGREQGMLRPAEVADALAQHRSGLDEEVHECLQAGVARRRVFHGVGAAGRGANAR